MKTDAIPTIRLKGDKRLRDKLFTPGAYAHPAKGHIGMWQEMIEKYSQPGDTILDPMGGIGTSLVAALMGRNVVCVELETHFIEPMVASWEKMRQHPMLGYQMGQVLILRGDARALPLGSVEAVVTSPPYEGQNVRAVGEEPYGSKRYGGMKRQIKNTNPYTRPVRK